MKLIAQLLGVLLVLALIAFSVWAWVAAPCSWYRYSHARDIPGRCITWVR